MKLIYILKVFLFAIITSLSAIAQNSKIRGAVIEDKTGEPLFSANIIIKGTSNGTSTDLDGNFELSTNPGTYALEISFIGLNSTTITGVIAKADDVTFIDNVRLKPINNKLKVVTITAEAIRNTESTLLTIKKKSVNILDGISSQTFRKIGDDNAAAAVARVPGVSIQGGKYVFVRGLGDRYTKTQLNSMDIPGLDPDRNSLQMDIFPTNIMDNIIVLKSFTPDLPADFVGGLVNIETKEFPEKPVLNISTSIGFTSDQHFNSHYLKQEKGGPIDFLGFDDGTRDEPLGMGLSSQFPTDRFPAPTENSRSQTQSFNSELAAKRATSLMNFGLDISGGNQIKRNAKTYGYSTSFSYKNSINFYESYEQNRYRKDTDLSVFALRDEELSSGPLGINNLFVNGMIGGAMKTLTSKYKINLLHLQNSEESTADYIVFNKIISNNVSKKDILTYTERSISNVLISGEHIVDDGIWNIEWKVSPTYSRIEDKDFRVSPYLIEINAQGDTTYSIDPNEVAFPARFWRNLNEYNAASKIDIIWEHQLFGYHSKLKFGSSYIFKTRDYEILSYELLTRKSLNYTGDTDELLTDEFIWNPAEDEGTFIFGNYQRSNTYEGTQSTVAAYISEEFQVSARLKAIAGLRMEKYDQFYTGQNQAANNSPNDPRARVFDNDKVLDLFDLFPSLNLIYQLDENTNIRTAYFRTTARPSFKEKSTAEIVDPISGLTFIGNIDLIQTYVNNFDLRYEYFVPRNQTLAVSTFYKTFVNPIELASYLQDNDSFQPRNVGDARVMGIELEVRINLGMGAPVLEEFFLTTNVSFVDSRVKFDKSPNGDFDAKRIGLKKGEKLGDYRDMQGQASYIINAGLSYTGRENGYEASAYYNVQGPKLIFVGLGLSPDIYSVPFHSLNFKVTKRFGKDNRCQLDFSVNNILDDLKEQIARSHEDIDRIFSKYNPGRTFSLSLRYSII